MNTKHAPGLLIAIDGIDGAGKTTQVDAITSHLEQAGLAVRRSKEPTNGTWGAKLRQSASGERLSLDDELEFFINDRREHVANLILPALQDGDVVILDRYFYSTLAYQGARGADISAIMPNVLAGVPIPDKTYILDLPASVAVSRIRNGRNETPNAFEGTTYLDSVRPIFQSIDRPEIVRIDSTQPADAITTAILNDLIESSFKAHMCFKPYGCDSMYCFARMSNQCQWFDVQGRLRKSLRSSAGQSLR